MVKQRRRTSKKSRKTRNKRTMRRSYKKKRRTHKMRKNRSKKGAGAMMCGATQCCDGMRAINTHTYQPFSDLGPRLKVVIGDNFVCYKILEKRDSEGKVLVEEHWLKRNEKPAIAVALWLSKQEGRPLSRYSGPIYQVYINVIHDIQRRIDIVKSVK